MAMVLVDVGSGFICDKTQAGREWQIFLNLDDGLKVKESDIFYSVNLCRNEWDAYNDAVTRIVCMSNKLDDICMHWWYSSEMIPVKP